MTWITNALLRTGANRDKENMLWNMIGSFCYAFASMVLSFLVMRLAGEEQGGIFAFGFSTVGQQMFLLAYFGIRPFQITDGKVTFRFGDYLHLRYVTCLAAMILGVGYLGFSGYTAGKAVIIFLLIGYKVIDGFADVYESEFQRLGRLDLTGKSNTFRTVLSVGVFLATLIVSKKLGVACVAAVCGQAAGVWLFDVAVLHGLEKLIAMNDGESGMVHGQAGCNPVDYAWSFDRMRVLVAETILLFVSVFLDFYVFSAAKYAIDANLNDAASGYFNVIFMPTSVINLAAGFVIRPFLTYLTIRWTEQKFEEFAGKLVQLSAVISGLTVLAVAGVAVLGRPVLGILEMLLGSAYTGKLTIYELPFGMIVLGGGFYAILNLYYYALVIMRKQKVIFGIYLVMAGVAAVLAPQMVIRGGIFGAAAGYLILMGIMAVGFVGLAWLEYGRGRRASE